MVAYFFFSKLLNISIYFQYYTLQYTMISFLVCSCYVYIAHFTFFFKKKIPFPINPFPVLHLLIPLSLEEALFLYFLLSIFLLFFIYDLGFSQKSKHVTLNFECLIYFIYLVVLRFTHFTTNDYSFSLWQSRNPLCINTRFSFFLDFI